MKTKNRIKPQPITTRSDFDLAVDELATLEATRRRILAECDLEIQAVKTRFAERLEPIEERMKGKGALALAYAEAHRAELLPKDKKSATTTLATFGWRTGNRTVALLSRVTTEHAIAALKALGLGAFVRQKEEVAKDLILAACKDDKTLVVVVDPCTGAEETRKLADAGLKITQGETFFVEPLSDTAETIKPAEVKAA